MLDPSLWYPHLQLRDLGACESVCTLWKAKCTESVWRELFNCYFKAEEYDATLSWRANCKRKWKLVVDNVHRQVDNISHEFNVDYWYDEEVGRMHKEFEKFSDVEWDLLAFHVFENKDVPRTDGFYIRLAHAIVFSSPKHSVDFIERLVENAPSDKVKSENMEQLREARWTFWR